MRSITGAISSGDIDPSELASCGGPDPKSLDINDKGIESLSDNSVDVHHEYDGCRL